MTEKYLRCRHQITLCLFHKVFCLRNAIVLGISCNQIKAGAGRTSRALGFARYVLRKTPGLCCHGVKDEIYGCGTVFGDAAYLRHSLRNTPGFK